MIPENFHFLRPAWLWALVMLAVFGWSWRRRSRGAGDWERACDPHLLARLALPQAGSSARFPLALLALGWSAACLAMAGPTWERQPQASFREPARSVFVLSLGDSMNARDVRPSRLARARHKLLDALERTPGASVALVVVREEAFAVTPLTDDAEVLREAIPLLETRLMPGRAVRPARGFEEARRLLEPVGLHGARILLVSDGSDDDPNASEAAVRALASDGAQVSVLGVAGESEALAALARSGGGAFAPLAIDDGDLERVLAETDAASPTGGGSLVHSSVTTDAWQDRGAWLLWLPLLLAPLAFRKGWAGAALAILCVQLAPAPAQADARDAFEGSVRDAFERPDQRGARAFAEGRFAESAQAFEDPSWQAAARYRAGDFAGVSHLLAERSDAASQYNLGNALAKAGQLEAAVGAYERALAAAPADADARFNRDLVKRLLEQQKQQEQPQQASQDSKNGQDPDENPAQDPSQGEKADQQAEQGQGEGSRADAPSEGSDASQSEAGKQAEDAAAEAEAAKNANAANAGDQAKAQDAAADAAQAKPEAEANAEVGARESGASRGKDASGSPADLPAPESQAKDLPAPESQATDLPAPDSQPAEAPESHGVASGDARPLSAQEQEHAQWMARLPDDPGGLLREKIRRDYQRKRAARAGEEEQ